MPDLLAHAIEDSTDIFGISEGGFETPKPPPRYATSLYQYQFAYCPMKITEIALHYINAYIEEAVVMARWLTMKVTL